MSRSSAKLRYCTAASFAIAAVSLACDSITITSSGTGSAQGCQVSWDSKMPTWGGAYFRVESPTNCPFVLNIPKYLTYAANASFPGGSTLQQYLLSMSDRQGRTFAVAYNQSWANSGSNNLLVISGDYFAGGGGWDGLGNGFDQTDNQILTGQGWSHGLGKLSYKQGIAGVNLKAPAKVGNGVPFNVSATTNDPEWISPVTWSWRVNGVPVGNSGPLLQWEGNGSNQAIGVTGTDYNGKTYSRLIQVGACPGTQINC